MKSPKLTFDYYNQLQLVQDPQGARQGMGDLPDQEALLKELNINPGNNPTHNYIYDAIGQLVEDRTEGLRINWRVDGKVASISKGHHTTTTNDDVVIQFHYDGLGNRISKETLKAGEATQQTYYTRDAQGNVMAVYGEGGTTTIVRDTPAELTVGEVANTETDIYARNHITSTTTIADKQTLNFTAGQSITLSPGFEAKQGSNATLKIGDVPATTSKEGEEVAGVFLKEHHIYGSSRLGILAHDKLIIAENPEATNEPTGKKNYELTNHLGNVLSVISDERNGNKPDVIAFNDYYPFGMLLPNRHGSSDKYRYGFNGKEKDDEVKGEGVQYDYGFRIYDARLSKFLSIDPLEKSFPWYTPYQFAGNKPINSIDLDGLEEYESYHAYALHSGEAALSLQNLDGNNGVWLTEDRVNQTLRWSNAMKHITQNQDVQKFTIYGTYSGKIYQKPYPFSAVRDYYGWIQRQVDAKGYKSRWAIGAAYLVDELADTFEATEKAKSSISIGGLTGGQKKNLGELMKDLNLGIAEYATGKFNGLLYGEAAKNIDNWYEWDSNFVWEEQVTVAAPKIYPDYEGTIALTMMNALSRNAYYVPGLISKHFFPRSAKSN